MTQHSEPPLPQPPLTPTTTQHAGPLATTTTTTTTTTASSSTQQHSKAKETTEKHSIEAQEDEPHEWTWQGKVFGTQTRGVPGYIATDEGTARRATTGATMRWRSIPTDHKAVGQSFSLSTWNWNEAARMTRAHHKPIGWALDETRRQAWDEAIRRGEHTWTPSWTIYDVNAFAETLVQYGATSQRRHQGRSPAEENVKQDSQTAHDDEARVRLRQQFWQERRRIKRENTMAIFAKVLQNIQTG